MFIGPLLILNGINTQCDGLLFSLAANGNPPVPIWLMELSQHNAVIIVDCRQFGDVDLQCWRFRLLESDTKIKCMDVWPESVSLVYCASKNNKLSNSDIFQLPVFLSSVSQGFANFQFSFAHRLFQILFLTNYKDDIFSVFIIFFTCMVISFRLTLTDDFSVNFEPLHGQETFSSQVFNYFSNFSIWPFWC